MSRSIRLAQPPISCPTVSGVASIRCVRPILTTSANSLALASMAWCTRRTAGISALFMRSAAAMCMAVGKVSFEDCDMFTSSLGWMGFFEPSTPPASSMARLEITSLAFMLVCVPLPVCQMRSGKLVVELAGDHFVGRLRDQARLFRRQLAEFLIHQRRGLFQNAEGANQLRRHDVAADVEMHQRARRLRAPVDVRGHFDRCPCCRFRCGWVSWSVASLMADFFRSSLRKAELECNHIR